MEIGERAGLKRRAREIQTVSLTQESEGEGVGDRTLRMKTGIADLTSEDVLCPKSPRCSFHSSFSTKQKEKKKRKKRICVTSIVRVAVEKKKNQEKMFFQLGENTARRWSSGFSSVWAESFFTDSRPFCPNMSMFLDDDDDDATFTAAVSEGDN